MLKIKLMRYALYATGAYVHLHNANYNIRSCWKLTFSVVPIPVRFFYFYNFRCPRMPAANSTLSYA